MLRYALKRILGAIPTLLLVIAIAFLMVHSAPGGPFDSERALAPAIERNVERYYHLDESMPRQFLRYLDGLRQGDLGPSYRLRDYSVAELIGGALPLSMRLGAAAMILALALGVTAGVVAALKKNTLIDRFVSGL